MCGIAGLWSPKGLSEDELRRSVGAMTDVIAHRGPDGGGTWVDPGAGIGLGHRRLAVIELSDAGAQPLVSNSGRYAIPVTGERISVRIAPLRNGQPGGLFLDLKKSDGKVLDSGLPKNGTSVNVPQL